MDLFRPVTEQVVERLRGLDIDRLTPLDALNLLVDLRRRVERED
jgi:hypothetical protein